MPQQPHTHRTPPIGAVDSIVGLVRRVDDVAPRTIFLADALGAALTAATNGIALVRLDALFGIGRDVLHLLAGAALCIGTLSLSVVLARPVAWPRFLRMVAILNGAYVPLAWMLLARRAIAPTPLAWLYVTCESLVLAAIVALEWRYASVHRGRPIGRRS